MIHQELNPEPHLTIAESIFLKREDVFPGTPFLSKKRTNERAARLLREFEIDLNPKLLVEELTIAQMQMMEIIKAVSCNARLVIMDEPTSALDSEETERLIKTIRNLKAAGVTVIYISHRMEEIFKICDAYSVFRDGRFIGSGDVASVSTSQLIAMMVGREVKNIFPKTVCPIGGRCAQGGRADRQGLYGHTPSRCIGARSCGFPALWARAAAKPCAQSSAWIR
jgi:ribose transport system ATP-binding protein/inositol transport system ATP-binding protein